MYSSQDVLKVLILVIAAVVHTAALPIVTEFGIATTVLGDNPGPNITSFLELIPASFTAQLEVTSSKRNSIDCCLRQDGTSSTNTTATLITICIILEAVLVFITIWIVVYICIHWRRETRRLQRNPERQRAEQLLEYHPQPLDTGSNAAHFHPADNLISNSDSEMATTVPGAPGYCNTERSSPTTGARDRGIRDIRFSTTGSAEGKDVATTAIPRIHVTSADPSQTPELGVTTVKPDTRRHLD